MSRTYRRKGYSRDRAWLLREWDFTPGCRMHRWIDPKSEEGRKRIAKYHSDAGSFMGNAPSWYCNIYQRVARQEARRQLHLYMRNPENLDANTGYTVMIDPNHHHCATWAWW